LRKKQPTTASRTPELELPSTWYRNSGALMAAARTLWPKVRAGFPKPGRRLYPRQFRDFQQHAPAFLLLCAFAVENALKGTKVKHIRKRESWPVFSAARQSPASDRVWGHDLPQLARDVRLETTADDDERLHVLQRNIEWAGRYPRPEGKGSAFIQRYGADDLRQVVSLIARIKRA
jgi:hypothetical protein